ncbi:MAG: DMT family transporter [Bdellovibrionales bacterium]|nr:DMT family transporter [Bdellovibrionales bacterium]
MNATLSYILTLASAACFSSASLVFADISRKVSPLWMNTFKAIVAWLCFLISMVAFGLWSPVSSSAVGALLISGMLGLAIGDIFLLTAYARMGAARTLIVFGFQPLMLGISAHFLFGQDLYWLRLLAVLFFIGCLFVFSLERYKRDGHWEVFGLGAAMVAMFFDGSGLLLSRWAFEQTPDMSAIQANVFRTSGALFTFLVMGGFRKFDMRAGWRRLPSKSRVLAVIASVFGCYISLILYLSAVKVGHLASVAAIGLAGPILTSVGECIYERKWPSPYLVVALSLFTIGFLILTLL